jgi:quinol monooxygenase YgiN
VSQEIFAIAVVRPEEGHEQEVMDILRDLYAVMTRKNYSRNTVYRDRKDSSRLINFRYWMSEEARTRAQEDPEVHRCWARLGQVAKVEFVMEHLDEVFLGAGSAVRS